MTTAAQVLSVVRRAKTDAKVSMRYPVARLGGRSHRTHRGSHGACRATSTSCSPTPGDRSPSLARSAHHTVRGCNHPVQPSPGGSCDRPHRRRARVRALARRLGDQFRAFGHLDGESDCKGGLDRRLVSRRADPQDAVIILEVLHRAPGPRGSSASFTVQERADLGDVN